MEVAARYRIPEGAQIMTIPVRCPEAWEQGFIEVVRRSPVSARESDFLHEVKKLSSGTILRCQR